MVLFSSSGNRRVVQMTKGRRAAIILFVASVIAVTDAHQTAKPKKTAPKPHPKSSSFTCPDPEAAQGCKSYEELVKAKDNGLPDTGYVCFRKNEDEFFVIWFNAPFFKKHWDSELKKLVVDDDATAPGRGHATSYK